MRRVTDLESAGRLDRSSPFDGQRGSRHAIGPLANAAHLCRHAEGDKRSASGWERSYPCQECSPARAKPRAVSRRTGFARRGQVGRRASPSTAARQRGREEANRRLSERAYRCRVMSSHVPLEQAGPRLARATGRLEEEEEEEEVGVRARPGARCRVRQRRRGRPAGPQGSGTC
jgi:hypothetical protein